MPRPARHYSSTTLLEEELRLEQLERHSALSSRERERATERQVVSLSLEREREP